MSLCVAALLSLSPDPQELLDSALEVYDMLRAVKLRASDYLAIAAYQIASQTEPANYQNVVNRARVFYNGLKAHHFFHAGKDDYIFAAMLGLSDLDAITGIERIERFYNLLNGEFWNKSSTLALSQVLVIGGSGDSDVCRVLALRNALRVQKIKMDKSYTLPTLGLLALLPIELDIVVRDLAEAQQVLRTQKGFSPLSVTTQELLIFAAALVTGEYAENMKDGVLTATLSTSIANIIIAQQTAMIVAISASTAAAASSSSSS